MSHKLKRWLKTIITDILVVTALYFLVKYLGVHWYQIVPHLGRIRLGYVIVAAVPTLAMLWLSSWGWTLIMRWLGVPLSAGTGFQLYYQSSIFRYIPGSLWYVPGRGVLCQQQGISLVVFGKSALLELFFLLAVAVMLSAPVVAIRFRVPWFSVLALGAWVSLVLVLIFPRHFRTLIMRARGTPASNSPQASLVSIVWTYIGIWVTYGISVNVLLLALKVPMAASILTPLYVMGGSTAAWTIGFLSFIPTGLGIREASLVSLFQPLAAAELIIVLGLVQRALEVLLESALWLFILIKQALDPPPLVQN